MTTASHRAALGTGVLVGALLASVPARACAGEVRLHYPPENLVVSGEGVVHVLAEALGPSIDGMEVRLPPRTWRTKAETAHGRAVFHVRVTLAPGTNQIEIRFVARGQPGAASTRTVFFVSPLAGEWDPPTGFARKPFHAARAPDACTACHDMPPRPSDAAPGRPRDSSCYSCHANLVAQREVHGPAASWACTRCHDPAATPAPYATSDPVMPLCFSCHAEQKDRFYGSPYQHGPTATGRCTICHDPHGTDHPFFLKRAAWELCTTCHAEKATGRHVISWGPSGQTHPTRARPDPVRPERELSCASCHNPHAAPSPKLWNFNATFYLDLCRNCHRAILGG